MNFDIKDVKSWANRHDVKTLSVAGFFGNSLSEIDAEIKRYNNGEKDRSHELYMISDNGCCCFGYALYFVDTGAFGGTSNFAFFLPLDAVKEDKPKEKKYRPFKTIKEIKRVINNGNDIYRSICVGADIILRLKRDHDRIEHILITNITKSNATGELLFINTYSPQKLLECYEIRVGAHWLPFGVEVKE